MPVDRAARAEVLFAAMKKHAAKTKSAANTRPPAAKAGAAGKAGTKTPKLARTAGAVGYTPPPLKSDGWPPFRYPLQ